MAGRNRRQPGTVLGTRTLVEIRRYKVWDCSSCGRTGFNANKCLQCPFCGNSKDASDREERSATEVDDSYQFVGANITCIHCGTENKHRFSCIECGAALDEKFKKEIAFLASTADPSWQQRTVQVDDTGTLPDATETPWNDGASPDAPPEPVAQEQAEMSRPAVRERSTERETTPAPTSPSYTTFFIVAAVIAIVGFVGMYLYKQWSTITPTTATVSSISWTYTLPREDYAARNHSNQTEDPNWEPPFGSFAADYDVVFSRYQPIYDDVWVEKTCTRTVDNSHDDTDGTWVEKIDEVSYDCSGYEREKVDDLPIYANRWTWKQMEWADTTPLTARGDSHVVTFPQFVPTTTLRQDGPPITVFTATFSYMDDDGDINTSSRSYPRPVWEEVDVGESYDAAVDGFDQLRAVSGLDPQYDLLMK